MVEQHFDGALIEAFSAIAGKQGRLGGSVDSNSVLEINCPTYLDRAQAQNLFRSSKLIQKIVELLPQDAGLFMPEWILGESGIEASEIENYFKDIECLGVNLPYKRNPLNAFVEAGILARLYGDAYILLGIDDGLEPSLPVNEKSIKSVSWVAVLDENRVSYDPMKGGYFVTQAINKEFNTLSGIYHASRVIHLTGHRLPGDLYINNGYKNDSVIVSLIKEFSDYVLANQASSVMLQENDIFIYKIKDFSKLIAQKGKALVDRLYSILTGKSVVGGLVMDADKEDGSFISRSYGGIKDVLNALLDAFVAVSDMPRSKLLGSSNSSAFSEGGLSDRWEWKDCVARYQNLHWRSGLEELTRYIFLAKDSPTKGVIPKNWKLRFKPVFQLSDQEKAELDYKNSQTDSIYFAMADAGGSVISALEIRESRFESGDSSIVLNSNGYETPKASRLPVAPESSVLSDPQAEAKPQTRSPRRNSKSKTAKSNSESEGT